MPQKSLVRKLTGTLGVLCLPVAAFAGVAGCAVAAKPAACTVSISPVGTLLNETETLTVKTVPGTIVTTSVRYPGTSGSLKTLKANSQGIAKTTYSSGTHPGVIGVVARTGTGTAARQCTTAFGVANGSFTLKQQPKCPEGTAVFRSKNVPAIIQWNVQGASGADLYVDGNGIYNSYDGPSGSQSFLFSCNSGTGTTEKHTYTLKTKGGVTVSATIVASSKIIDEG